MKQISLMFSVFPALENLIVALCEAGCDGPIRLAPLDHSVREEDSAAHKLVFGVLMEQINWVREKRGKMQIPNYELVCMERVWDWEDDEYREESSVIDSGWEIINTRLRETLKSFWNV